MIKKEKTTFDEFIIWLFSSYEKKIKYSMTCSASLLVMLL